MKRTSLAAALAIAIAISALAKSTVTLSVPTMDCPVCPITVPQSMLLRADEVVQ